MQMRTILRPDFVGQTKRGERITPTTADYILVPRLETIGTFKLVELLPWETLVDLSRFRETLPEAASVPRPRRGKKVASAASSSGTR